ncbi:hypothetical protein HYU11_01645 [Candidatus Woesearchaeota archaeon]|nr:hypothetical protein [Candidatus Woesearchaeota archaeon]
MAKKKRIQNFGLNNLTIPETKFRPKIMFGKVKRKLTSDQEFQIMKIVLDKFLWLGFGIMAFGLFQLYSTTELSGFLVMIAGAAVLMIFIWILVREYEISGF